MCYKLWCRPKKAVPHADMVILRDIEKHPANVHYTTAGQLKTGKLFAEVFLEYVRQLDGLGARTAPPNCPVRAMDLTADFVFK